MDETDVLELIENYKNIKDRVEYVSNKFDRRNVALVAVSKTKPVEMIRILYEKGHRHFGENYVIQELIQKSEELASLNEIKWHYIGSIQSNKIKHLASVKNLYVVETVEKKEVLDKFAKSWDLEKSNNTKLNIMIQVNTSQEESKSGCHPNDCLELVKYCVEDEKCKEKLNFLGLMTIGSPNATEDQPDFKCLVECKNNIAKNTGIPLESIQLSMGMSHDFEPAIEFGSTSVRVGSAIFGDRDYSKKN
ncbi:hypothetical protein DICPUDRAFT_28875 [Dictyostelium purpureum]|uniref:Pyridoxal phosphate homeostasis protein n=1 Tax=Dictyostelium purpureum TaxID=5786 RepID=F0ZCK4_DICPU|nr:uncharacterized protein DICPUDRAFT_28875 [Dictyostelium purpureum]EGC38313.1 hypothetical protein DICPUDRAFT_28875 [Dictyostelium purpureum]|eukprot:XP_003285174.1 hypothetical protein DICPUDRAFT_28875 [Dictyostelium purpureum]